MQYLMQPFVFVAKGMVFLEQWVVEGFPAKLKSNEYHPFEDTSELYGIHHRYCRETSISSSLPCFLHQHFEFEQSLSHDYNPFSYYFFYP
jgi:hypothetical protein